MFITREYPALTVGNFLGDMIRNTEMEQLPSRIRAGVLLHRFIDSYTDSHKNVRQVVRLLRPTQGKYAPVAADVLFDHILASYWEMFANQEYSAFCSGIYDMLEMHMDDIPHRLRTRTERMIAGRWIEDYDKEHKFMGALQRLDMRTRFPSMFRLLPEQYRAHQEILDEQFLAFFPQLLQEAGHRINLQNGGRS